MLSWVVSPLMSGMISGILLTIIEKFIMNAKEPLQAGLMALPVIYGLTIFINVLTVTMNGSKCKSTEANCQTSLH